MKSWIAILGLFAAGGSFFAIGNAFVWKEYGLEVGSDWQNELRRLDGKIRFQDSMSTANGDFTIAISNQHPIWTAPSGPSVYVIDQSNRVVDFSIDVGQDKGVLRRFPDTLDVLSRISTQPNKAE
jgi:hypothetical protein